MGTQDDGSDSLAVQIAPQSHWPTMRALVLVASAKKKKVSSTNGMQTTVATSGLFPRRAEIVVPKAMKDMTQAILDRDFQTFAAVTMAESNSFHSVCSDTVPRIQYMNQISFAACDLVEEINAKAGKLIAAYTFDAGPNAVIYYEEENTAAVAGAVKSFLGEVEGFKDSGIEASSAAGLDETTMSVLKEGVQRVILTSVGGDPVRVEESLIDDAGEPVHR